MLRLASHGPWRLRKRRERKSRFRSRCWRPANPSPNHAGRAILDEALDRNAKLHPPGMARASHFIEQKAEVLENISTYALHPKSGNYGEDTGQWVFTIAGTKRTLKAKIADPEFLPRYTDGTIRFYAQDWLKARVHEKQVIDGEKVKVQNEIIEVVEYRPAHPSERQPTAKKDVKRNARKKG